MSRFFWYFFSWSQIMSRYAVWHTLPSINVLWYLNHQKWMLSIHQCYCNPWDLFQVLRIRKIWCSLNEVVHIDCKKGFAQMILRLFWNIWPSYTITNLRIFGILPCKPMILNPKLGSFCRIIYFFVADIRSGPFSGMIVNVLL